MTVSTYFQIIGAANNTKVEVDTAPHSVLCNLTPASVVSLDHPNISSYCMGNTWAFINLPSGAVHTNSPQVAFRWSYIGFAARIRRFDLQFLPGGINNAAVMHSTCKLLRGDAEQFYTRWGTSDNGKPLRSLIPQQLRGNQKGGVSSTKQASQGNADGTSAGGAQDSQLGDFVTGPSSPGTTGGGGLSTSLLGGNVILDTNPIAVTNVSQPNVFGQAIGKWENQYNTYTQTVLFDVGWGDQPIVLLNQECIVAQFSTTGNIANSGLLLNTKILYDIVPTGEI